MFLVQVGGWTIRKDIKRADRIGYREIGWEHKIAQRPNSLPLRKDKTMLQSGPLVQHKS